MKKPKHKNTFSVKQALLPTEDGNKHLERWYIYRDYLPVEALNQFINARSGRSPGTGKTYAYSLASWLNFLDKRDTVFDEATRDDVDAFVDYLAYGMHCNCEVTTLTADITYSTLALAITAIQGFYRWFERRRHVDVFDPVNSKKAKPRSRLKAKSSFLYGQIYEVHVEEIIVLENMRLKISGFKKHWLTESEKKDILDGLRTVRDKAIFMLLTEGMRIDEVLSVKFSAYDREDLSVKPSRSKGYGESYEDKLRIIAFHDQRTAVYLDQYIQTERADVESELDDFLVPLFVNIKNHPLSYGRPVSYRNYWGVLKGAADRAGINPDQIATHVGRRSFIQEKLEEGEDFEIIRQMVGWASLGPLDKYRNLKSKTLIKNAANARREKWDDDSK